MTIHRPRQQEPASAETTGRYLAECRAELEAARERQALERAARLEVKAAGGPKPETSPERDAWRAAFWADVHQRQAELRRRRAERDQADRAAEQDKAALLAEATEATERGWLSVESVAPGGK
jgi:putative heme degradation protein